jgi:hypothetical protein
VEEYPIQNTMKPTKTLLTCLLMGLVFTTAFSQVRNSSTSEETSKTEATKKAGLKKIAGGNALQYKHFDSTIDAEALEASIELAVENAMHAMEVELDKFEIHIEPIEINLDKLNIDLGSYPHYHSPLE